MAENHGVKAAEQTSISEASTRAKARAKTVTCAVRKPAKWFPNQGDLSLPSIDLHSEETLDSPADQCEFR